MAHGGKRDGAGRRPGSQNKATKDIREAILAQGDLVSKGFELMSCGDKKVEAAAWRTLMEYGYGKPVQPLSGADGGPVAVEIVTNLQMPPK